jgi:hypothetical protein
MSRSSRRGAAKGKPRPVWGGGRRFDNKIVLVCTDRGRHDPMTAGYAFWNNDTPHNQHVPGRVQFRNAGKQRTYAHPGRSSEDIANMRRVGEMRTETMICRSCPLSVPMTRAKWQPFVMRRGAVGATQIDLSLERPIPGVDFDANSS